MSDLLKEAIADAKAVRETALQNAKMALEEAFTPQLKNMLSAKLKEDEFEDEEVPFEDEMPGEEPEIPEVPAEEGYYEDDEIPGEEIPDEGIYAGHEPGHEEDNDEKEEEAVFKEGDGYKEFFQKALKKWGVSSPKELEGGDKKEFYDYVDRNWKADKETD